MSELRQRTTYHRDERLRKLARDKPCMVARVIETKWAHFKATVVWAHSNLEAHGKGGSIKAHDCFGFLACFHCHSMIDQGGELNKASRRELQLLAMSATRRYLVNEGLIVGASLPCALDDGWWLMNWLNGRIQVAR